MNFRFFLPRFVVLIALVLTGCTRDTGKTGSTMTAQEGTFVISIPATGEFKAVKSTPIRVPPQIEGDQTIAWIAPENAPVKEGDVVVKLSGDWYRDRIKEEEYALAKLEIEIDQKKRQLEKEKIELDRQMVITGLEKKMAEDYGARDDTIYSRNEIIDSTMDLEYLQARSHHLGRQKEQLEKKAMTEIQLLQLKKKTHQVRVNQYSVALNSLSIKAPHDGMLVYQKNWRGKPHVGMQVWRGMKLANLPDLGSIEARVYVLESRAQGLKKGQAVTLVPDSSPGTIITGKVKNVDNIANPLDREIPLKYFEVKVELEKSDPGIMKPGSHVKAIIKVKALGNVISVPHQALFYEKGKPFLNIFKGGDLEKRAVTLGDRSLTRTVILSGIEPGEEVALGRPGPEEGK